MSDTAENKYGKMFRTGPEALETLFGPLQLEDEKRLQADIEAIFEKNGIPFEREVRLSPKDIPDFVVAGNVAVEVKVKGSPREIYRQCERYLRHDLIDMLVLVTAKSICLPEKVNGKPVIVVSLGAAWL